MCSSLLFEQVWSYSYQVGPARGADLVLKGHDLCYMQIHLAAHKLFFHPNGLKQMKTSLNMAALSWNETWMGVVWEWYLRQLSMTFNFTGVIFNGAGGKPNGNIISQHLMQDHDILAARWKHLLGQIKGQN